MSFIWFIVALVFFILWLTKAPKPKDIDSENLYEKGYRDAQRDFQMKTQSKQPLPQAPLQHQAPVHTPAYVHQAVTHPAAPAAVFVQPAPKPHNPAQTLNVVLYLASFLLVAAAAALIAASMPAGIKLAGLIAVVVLFYGAGMILHETVKILRPAAIAFIGTGLAILPFVGFALTGLTGIPGSTSWLIISIVGVIAYYAAAVVLQSQVVSYLTLGFILSLSCSAVALTDIGFVWYFVALIVVALIASVVSYFKPAWVPAVFAKPIDQTGQYVTPIALGAAILSSGAMDLRMFEIVFTAATLQYIVQLLQKRTQTLEIFVRIGIHITLLLYAGDLANGNLTTFGIIWLVLGTAQVVYSLIRVQKKVPASRTTETVALVIAIMLAVCGLGFWAASGASALLSILTWVVVAISGMIAGLRFRSAHWGYAPLIGSLFIPSLLTQSVIEPALPKWVLVIVFLVYAGVATWALSEYRQRSVAFRTVIYSAIAVYFVTALTYAGLSGSVWVALAFASGAVIATSISLIAVLPSFMIAAGISFYLTVAAFLSFMHIEAEWFALLLGTVSAFGTFLAAAVLHEDHDRARRNYLAAVTVTAFATSAAGLLNGATTASAIIYGLFALVAIGTLSLRIRRPNQSLFVSGLLLITYICYTFLFWIAGLTLGNWWLVGAYVIDAMILWIASHLERVSWLLLGAYGAVIAAIAVALDTLGAAPDWHLMFVTWTAAAIFGIAYSQYVTMGDRARQWLSISSVWAVLLVGAASGIGSNLQLYPYAAAFSLAIVGASAIIHARIIRQRLVAEVGIYIVVLALQWTVAIAYPGLTFVVYAYWWAAAIALVAYLYKSSIELRLMVALGIITFFTGGYALADGGGYSLLFLIQHVIVAAVGAVTQKRWALWWGVVASVIAVIYFLRNYLYLWLALLGLFLIGIVVWRLIALGKRGDHQA